MEKIILKGAEIFKDADFDWCVCGGYALDIFAGKKLRDHGDFDMCFFKQDRKDVLQYLIDKDWPVYGRQGGWDTVPIKQAIFYKVTDINDPDLAEMGFWAVKPNGWMEMYELPRTKNNAYSYFNSGFNADEFTFIEVAFNDKEGDTYILQDNPKITLPMERAILFREGVPYLAPEIILFFKTDEWSATNSYLGPKMITDFQAVMPLMSQEQKDWLLDAIKTAHGEHTPWLDKALEGMI